MEENNKITRETVESHQNKHTKRVTVRRVGSQPQDQTPNQGRFKIRTNSSSPFGCLWFILIAVAGLFAMGCAGLIALVIAAIAGLFQLLNKLTGKMSSHR